MLDSYGATARPESNDAVAARVAERARDTRVGNARCRRDGLWYSWPETDGYGTMADGAEWESGSPGA
jgi:hypothetical protein